MSALKERESIKGSESQLAYRIPVVRRGHESDVVVFSCVDIPKTTD